MYVLKKNKVKKLVSSERVIVEMVNSVFGAL